MQKKTPQGLADRIASIIRSAPASYDPEDDDVDNTRAKIVQYEDEDNVEEAILSKIKKQNIDLLDVVDTRYAGKKVSRKNLRDSDQESSEGGDDSAGEENQEESDDESTGNFEEEDDEESADEEQSEDDSEGDGSSEDIDASQIDLNDHEEKFKHFNETDALAAAKKATCVRNQTALWEYLLEMRIQLQKCLVTANKLPQKDVFTEIKQQSGSDFMSKVGETKATLSGVLDKMLLLQNLLLKQYPETKTLEKEPESEVESEVEEEVEEKEDETPLKKKRKLGDYSSSLAENHTKYREYRNQVIQKWNDKTRIAVAKTNTNSQSVLNQIEYILSNKDRLIKRTQLKRSQYTILGEKPTKEEDGDNEEHNADIFDDDDFYHQLLRELIEVKSADVTDPVQLSKQWIQLQNLRSKMKRKIDTRATKGRKIRYAVHTKLVNFMAPIDDNLWTEEAKNDLYSSLFGKNQPVFGV